MPVGGGLRGLGLAAALLALAAPAHAQPAMGPFNVEVLAGGEGLDRELAGEGWRFGGDRPWTVSGWVEPRASASLALVGGVGGVGAAAALVLGDGTAGVWTGAGVISAPLPPGAGWRFLAAVSDGARVRLYVDGTQAAEGAPGPAFIARQARLAPRGVAGFAPFGGRIAGFAVTTRALSAAEVRALAGRTPDPALIAFTPASPTWPLQLHGLHGLTAPQDAWTLPVSKAPPSAPRAIPAYDGPPLQPVGPRAWSLAKWRLASEAEAGAGGASLSTAGFDARAWRAATVPGTVLTTLVDRGVYPDPAYGLNNLAIPEGLGRQPWWYRTEFEAPQGLPPRSVLDFAGVSAAAEVWLNGERLGEIQGAFIRGRFDVAGRLHPGTNALAVRILPPRHPGIAHEQSMAAGAGPNGGLQALDGPVFLASEGWDWIPGVRDRNIGLWQGVRLTGSGDLRLGDPRIVTTLPKGDASLAEVEVEVEVTNLATSPREAKVSAAFDDVAVARTITAAPGETIVRFTPTEFKALRIAHPRLWWPNGYGEAALHTAHLSVSTGGAESDARDVRFGIRQITYELSLLDHEGALRRVEVDFARASALGQQVVDVRHEAIRKVEGGWAQSLTPAGESSPAVTPLGDTRLSPFLVLKVNGVRIAARGGSWGTDDFMKRSSREHLEPYFRLHRDAHVNIIRNWVGQNTEETFYDLADEYGLLIVNDFWASTQDAQEEPEDVPLFLANAADVIARDRNHPSIALWFGRNEGVPQPVLNEGLERLARTLDGTRWYSGSSNSVNLWFSGPYDHQPPETYFTRHGKGFAVEIGAPSFPTLEAFESAIAPADRWPIGDAWAYHDWHQSGNGDTHGFMNALTRQYGAPAGLQDFERKAQLLDYDAYRAIMEGMNAELWRKTSGRMLWMTQSAWPSTMWQLISHDYDAAAPFYAFKAAAEPVHVQMTLPDHRLQLIDNRAEPLAGARLTAKVVALDGRRLETRETRLDVAAGQVADGPTLDLARVLAREGAVVVALEARTAAGAPLSHNLYWLAMDDAGAQKLNAMAPQTVTLTARRTAESVSVEVRNAGSAPALNVKLTLLDAEGARVLPAYYSDNYISLLPGERRTVEIGYGPRQGSAPAAVALRGWNATPVRAKIRDARR